MTPNICNFGCFNNNKTYLIFGTGTTGQACAHFCQKNNLNFFITDDDPDRLQKLNLSDDKKLYKLSEKKMKQNQISYLLLSPSVHAQENKHKIVKLAEKLGIEIIADIDLFYCFLQIYNKNFGTNKQLIGITGTNGKSTTTALVAHIFNFLGETAIACGNIGLNYLELDVEKYEFFIAEMSSYNLFLMKYAQFNCGCLLNITEDHLSYHGNMQNYIDSKAKIIFNSKTSVICIDDEFCSIVSRNAKQNNLYCIDVSKNHILSQGLSWKNDNFYMDGNIVYTGKYKNLPGLHNIENILCAISVAILVFSETSETLKQQDDNIAYIEDIIKDIPSQIKQNLNKYIGKVVEKENININKEMILDFIKNDKQKQQNQIENICNKKKEINLIDIFSAVSKFTGLKHRMQFIANIDGVEFINDSKGTNANSTQQALRTYKDKNIYLIAGGQRKTAGFNFLKNDLANVQCVFLIGDASNSFAKELDILHVKYKKCEIMKNAVNQAFRIAKIDKKKNAIVLLSPLCASWDQYKSFEERGNDFIVCVEKIKYEKI